MEVVASSDKTYDVIVVGTGHAGCEAALASARMGAKTLALTLNLDNIALMPCNPAIGGPGKGHLVAEIHALGGVMGEIADGSALQSRVLNTGKGPAVQALRVLCDKHRYQQLMRRRLENQPLLDIKQALVTEILTDHGRVTGVLTATGLCYRSHAVVLATGVYLEARVITGEHAHRAGPNGQLAAGHLARQLERLGLPMRRFKTGTSPRVHAGSVDLDKMTVQPGEREHPGFSASWRQTTAPADCYLTYTTAETHAIINSNLHRAPLYTGSIEGTGPRYCPSIEDKVVRFHDKESHQVFLEPEGEFTQEMYVLGLSTSLPEEVQLAMLHSIPGCERAKIMRPGYAIEYDCLDPQEMTPSLECRSRAGLYCAGQINGSSGYEEAAAQGLLAGINAVRSLREEEPVVLGRDQAYIGVLIDDLITKGTDEPYRMLTARAEYRLLLRQDNADYRLLPLGFQLGLVEKERYAQFCSKRDKVDDLLQRLSSRRLRDKESLALVEAMKQGRAHPGMTLEEVLLRPNVCWDDMQRIAPDLVGVERDVASEVVFRVKYRGYLEKQERQVERLRKLEHRKIPQDFDYDATKNLSYEAREKLKRLCPSTVGQASRISGVSPADVAILLVQLDARNKQS